MVRRVFGGSEKFSKGQNRLRSALTSSGFEVLGIDGQRTDIKRKVNDIVGVYPKDFTFSKNEETILRPFLNRDSAVAIDQDGIQTIVRSAKETFAGKKQNIVLRTVFGATEVMPFRAFHYLIPAVNFAYGLQNLEYQTAQGDQKKGLSVNLEFIFMNQMGEIANGVNPFLSHEQTKKFTTISRQFLEKFYPEISDQVSFLDDRVFTPNIINSNDYKEVQGRLRFLNDSTVNTLISFPKSGGDKEKAINYGTMHVFVHDLYERSSSAPLVDIEKETGLSDYREDPRIFSMGASPEAFFYHLRKSLLKANGLTRFQPVETAQYLANINVPPYSMLESHDLTLTEVLNNPDILLAVFDSEADVHTPVRKAVKAMTKDCYIFELIEFFKERI